MFLNFVGCASLAASHWLMMVPNRAAPPGILIFRASCAPPCGHCSCSGRLLDQHPPLRGPPPGEDTIEPSIAGISFVLKNADGSEWFKPKSGGNASARFTSTGRFKGEWAQIADKIVEQEATRARLAGERPGSEAH